MGNMDDILSAASLLLAILAVLYGLWYPEISESLKIKPPTHRPDGKKDYDAVRAVLVNRSIPLTLASFLLSLVFLPDVIYILDYSFHHFYSMGVDAIKDYSSVSASFILVVLFSISLCIHMVQLTWNLWILQKNLNPKSS